MNRCAHYCRGGPIITRKRRDTRYVKRNDTRPNKNPRIGRGSHRRQHRPTACTFSHCFFAVSRWVINRKWRGGYTWASLCRPHVGWSHSPRFLLSMAEGCGNFFLPLWSGLVSTRGGRLLCHCLNKIGDEGDASTQSSNAVLGDAWNVQWMANTWNVTFCLRVSTTRKSHEQPLLLWSLKF